MHKNEQLQKTQQLLPLAENPDDLKTLLKLFSYAKNWQAFQKAIATGDTKDKQLKKSITTLHSRYNDNREDGYLFVFSPNVDRDIQQADQLLMRLVKF